MIKFSLCSCLILFFGGLVVADNLPVFICGPYDHYTPASALKSYDADEFIEILGQHITPETFTLVISEDQLSTEDLSQCRTSDGLTCFQGIRDIKNKLYLPSVQDPVAIIEDIAGLDRTEITVSSNGTLSEPLNAKGGEYVFINFDDDASDDSKSTKLVRHDQFVKKLSEDLSAQNLNVMIIYTGKRSEHQRRLVRQAAATNSSSETVAPPSSGTVTQASTSAPKVPKQSEVPPTFFKRPQLLLYFTDLFEITTSGNQRIDATNVSVNSTNTTTLAVTLEAGVKTLVFDIVSEKGYWWVDAVTWEGRRVYLNTRIYALDKFSFHCSPAIDLLNENRQVVLKWHGLQLEGQFRSDQELNSFSDSWDCVGFVSPGIVGGLFVVILMLFILSIGISWMMDINTMDRFDDPKGKTITISVNE